MYNKWKPQPLNIHLYLFVTVVEPNGQQRSVRRAEEGPPLAAEGQVLQQVEGAVLHPHEGLPALLQEGVQRGQDLRDGPVPVQGEADRRGAGRLGEQEDLQRHLHGADAAVARREDLSEGGARPGGLVRADRGLRPRVQGEEAGHQDIVSGEYVQR